MIGNVKDWHKPLNVSCVHNYDIGADYTCKRPGKRKPYRVVRVVDRTAAQTRLKMKPQIVVEIHPDGRMVFRELGKRLRFETTTARVLGGLRWRAAMVAAQETKKRRKK